MTFSVVFAYVADITSEEDRSSAYGLVSTYNVIIVHRIPSRSPWSLLLNHTRLKMRK